VSVTAPGGFVAGGLACGIKDSGALDLAIVATADHQPVSAAAVFTTNLVAAAPVQISRAHVADGTAAAVVLNSGNANAATGEAGRRDALRMCELTAASLGCASADVLVCSTGLIGVPLDIAPLEVGIPQLAGMLQSDETGAITAAEAILTTDTVRKESEYWAEVDGKSITVAGMAKGAAMLSPAMATMLAVLTTDAAVDPASLHTMLTHAVDASFNQLSVDGCTSTNDTVIVLASGTAGNKLVEPHDAGFHALGDALRVVCEGLAYQMARDAEGASKQVRVVVRGARSATDARMAARAVATSQLVQCSLNGGDPYWGRVLSELGASGAVLDPDLVDISYNGIIVCRDGVAAAHDQKVLECEMGGREIEVTCDLHLGMSEAAVLTTDLSHAYIDENRRTS
jgi:glutamate N-acetyltransferase / amino-acid N-acetyltransferase